MGGRNRYLEVIPIPPGGYTIEYLKDVVQQAKVYIRPIQVDLEVDTELTYSVSYQYYSRCDIHFHCLECRERKMSKLWCRSRYC